MLRLLVGVCALIALSGAVLSDQPLEIKIGYLRQAPSRIRISLIDVPAGNDGLAGAQLAIEDNNTTGRFLNQRYTLIEKLLGEGDDPVAAMNALADQGASFIVTSLDADRLLKVADAGKARGETLDQRICSGRTPARAGLPRQRHSCRSDALDARRRACAISGLEEVAQMDAD